MTGIDLAEVCRRYGASVLRRCGGILGDADEAQDAAQEVFALILTRQSQFRGESDLGTWIYRITTNRCLNRLRGDRRREARDQQGEAWAGLPPANPYQHYALKEGLGQLLTRLDSLGQEILIYRYLDGMTQVEIAAATGKSRRTVGKRLSKIDALLARIGEEGP